MHFIYLCSDSGSSGSSSRVVGEPTPPTAARATTGSSTGTDSERFDKLETKLARLTGLVEQLIEDKAAPR